MSGTNQSEHKCETKYETAHTLLPYPVFENAQSTSTSYGFTFKSAPVKVLSENSVGVTITSVTATIDESKKKRARTEFEWHEQKISVFNSATQEIVDVKPSPSPLLSDRKKIVEKLISCTIDKNPEIYLKRLFESFLGFRIAVRPTLELSSQPIDTSQCSFFPPLTEENLNGYSIDVVSAIRDEDISTLQALHSSGRSLSCCNRFGESILHMACRRGFTSIVKFLVEETGVSVRITDDCGRTPLHDALWNRDCKFEIFNILVKIDPALLFVSDKRGHTPFAYARKDKWDNWIRHINSIKGELMDSLDCNVMELFREEVAI